jgi:hypothetical protein
MKLCPIRLPRAASAVRVLVIAAALSCGLTSTAPAQDSPSPAKEGAGELDLRKFPGQVIDDVVVPVPSEIFGVLDKLGDPDWAKEITISPRPNFTDRSDVALLLGSVVADGFLAVQAEDKKAVEQIGRDVLELAKALGVRDTVVEHCNSIEQGAKNGDWDTVRKELDSTQRTVRERMESMKDGALAECVSVGGWLRGTQVVTSVIRKNFSAERAELLNQPDLASYFRDNIQEVIPKVAKPEKLKLISSGLAQIHELMKGGDESLNEEAVDTIQRITSELVSRINTKS